MNGVVGKHGHADTSVSTLVHVSPKEVFVFAVTVLFFFRRSGAEVLLIEPFG